MASASWPAVRPARSPIAVSVNSQLDFGGNDTGTTNNLTLNGAITFSNGSPTITVDSPTVIATIGGPLNGITVTTGSLTKAGPGTLVLVGKSDAPWLGVVNPAVSGFNAPVNVTGGTLSVNLISTVNSGIDTALGAPTTVANGLITLTGGDLKYTGAGNQTDRNITFTGSWWRSGRLRHGQSSS